MGTNGCFGGLSAAMGSGGGAMTPIRNDLSPGTSGGPNGGTAGTTPARGENLPGSATGSYAGDYAPASPGRPRPAPTQMAATDPTRG